MPIPPSERCRATAPGHRVLDRISLRDHIVTVEIGGLSGRTRQPRSAFCFNVVDRSGPAGQLENDDSDRILS